MGRETGISWTRSTRNFWSGCTKIGPGCDGCYAEASSRRMRGVSEATGQAMNWGPGAPRVDHLAGADRDIRKWNELCTIERGGGKWIRLPREQRAAPPPGSKGGKILVRCFTEGWAHPGFWPVFINSYSDTFDNEVPQLWRRLLFTTIEECEALTFQLVTKRIGNVEDMLEGRWSEGRMPKNVWLVVTVVNQDELDRDGPKLLALAERFGFPVIGLSMEPQIGVIDPSRFLAEAEETEQTVWGIGGGESPQPGHPARPFHLAWALEALRAFATFNQPYFFKQTGSNVIGLDGNQFAVTGKGDNTAEWPEWLRVREFPT